MANGADHYWIGSTPAPSGYYTPAESFPSEWAWHAALALETDAIPLAEREANQRRVKALEEAWGQWESAYYRYKKAGKVHTEIVAMREPRIGDMVEHQIFEYTVGNVLAPVSISGVTSSALMVPPQTMIGALSGAVEAGSLNVSLQSGSMMLQGPGGQNTPAPDPWLAVLFQDDWTLGYELQALWTQYPPKALAGSATPKLDCSVYTDDFPAVAASGVNFNQKELNMMLGRTCDLANVLLEEWGPQERRRDELPRRRLRGLRLVSGGLRRSLRQHPVLRPGARARLPALQHLGASVHERDPRGQQEISLRAPHLARRGEEEGREALRIHPQARLQQDVRQDGRVP
jgi:hypothetical protein